MHPNPLFAIDFYKVDHRRQYPEGTTEIYSNFTPRYIKHCSGLLPDFDGQVVVFGIQHFIQDYLINSWQKGFFDLPKDEVVNTYKNLIQTALGLDDFDCSHIASLHDLGYLPIKIKALSEGQRSPIGVPVLTVVNTHPDFFWLTNYLETIISASIWKPMTTATIAFEFKRLLNQYAKLTGIAEDFINYQAHDFSFRGMSGWHDASICGAAHLTSFQGTDCVPAIELLNHYYDAQRTVALVGCSVPATEHSVMTCNGNEGEFDTIKRLITEVYPTGIVSIVADSYNFWQTLTVYLPQLDKEINARQGKVVIRPDSGDPVEIVCGNPNAPVDSPAYKGALELLWDAFGGHINAAGYKELNPQIGLIYGDAITAERAARILQLMTQKGFASNNIVFGVGSYTYQYLTRDTLGFAMKATSAVIHGERKSIFKDPITANGSKKSAKGLLSIERDKKTGRLELHDNVTEEVEKQGLLKTIYENGQLVNPTNLAAIRDNLATELNYLKEQL